MVSMAFFLLFSMIVVDKEHRNKSVENRVLLGILVCSRQCSRALSSERFPSSGTVPEDGAFLESLVRNVGGNVYYLRTVWLDAHLPFLLYPAHFVEHGSKVV